MARRALRSLVRAIARDRSGSVSVLSIAFGGCLLASLAISVDVANVFLVRREHQGALDLAAMAAARDLTNAESSARAALAENQVANYRSLVTTVGRYLPDRAADPSKRFVAGGTPANAVRLEMVTEAPLFFGKRLLGAAPTLSTRSIAANTRVASFTIGTRLASLQGGIANALLSSLLGASISLNVMDYRALADAKVELPTLLSSVASQARLTALTYDDVLNASVPLQSVANALAETTGLAPASRLALQQIARLAGSNRITLGRMISFGPLGGVELGKDVGLSASASVLQTLTTALGLANGRNQLDFDLGVAVPGLLGLQASLTIGERPQSSPWFALDRESATVRTAQTRLRLTAKVGGVLGVASLNLPVALDLAPGAATLTAARCGRIPASDLEATLSVSTGVTKIWIGEPRQVSFWNDLSRPADVGPATVADTLLLAARASAYVGVENLQPVAVSFRATEIASGAVKTASTTSLLQSPLSSLTRNLQVSVDLKLLGLSLGTPKAVGETIAQALSPVGAALDPVLISVLDLLGLRLGEADVAVRGLRCDGSALVQ